MKLKKLTHLHSDFPWGLSFPKLHINTTHLSFQQERTAMDRALPIFTSSVCRCNRMETQELLKRKYMALRSNILLVTCLCKGQSHSPELDLKSRIYSSRTIHGCDTLKAALSSWGWVVVANSILCVGVFFYLETQ